MRALEAKCHQCRNWADAAVKAGGEAYMEEHVKLEKGSDPAPGLHFWEDTRGMTGKVYVGYLGRHLASFETNRAGAHQRPLRHRGIAIRRSTGPDFRRRRSSRTR